jgi:2-dehydropantoate 2-reductase
MFAESGLPRIQTMQHSLESGTTSSRVKPGPRIAVMGAGAVGCYYGGILARAGHAVTLIARPAHVQAISTQGLRMQGQGFDERVPLRASSDPAAVAGADLVLFCVKSADTEAAGRLMAPHLASQALVLSLQNGVDNAERLQAILPGHAVAAAVVYVAVDMAGPGHVLHKGRGELVLAPASAGKMDSEAAAAAFKSAGVPTEVSAAVREALWTKLLINCAYNAISAIGQQAYGKISKVPGIQDVMQDAVNECLAVAAGDGIKLPETVHEAVRRIAHTMPGQLSSTAQDLARGKPSEIDYLNGHVVRRGHALGIPTPVNRTLWSLVKLLESGAGPSR